MWCFGAADRRMDRCVGRTWLDYEYDIFLSYKRDPEAREWLIDHFQPLLVAWVAQFLGYRPTVFRDDHAMEAGTTWPVEIGRALGRSRVLVSLWTKEYFESEWCGRELATMLAREDDEQLRTPVQPKGLIVPVVLFDCAQVPSAVQHMQRVELRDCFAYRMRRDSVRSEELSVLIRNEIASGVAAAIECAPPWRHEWPLTTAAMFLDAVKRPSPTRQTHLPRLSR
jgi:hypothetical protein